MTFLGLIMLVLTAGYVALTCMGVSVTLGAQDFVNDAIGRSTLEENPPLGHYLIALVYVVLYMWAVGLVATWKGGRTKLYLKRAEETAHDVSIPLSAEEIHKLRAACDDLKETSQF